MKIKISAAKRLLLAMAVEKRLAMNKIQDLEDVLFEHFIKCVVFPNSSYHYPWLNEIRSWYTRIRQLGNNLKGGKRLKADDYYALLFQHHDVDEAHALMDVLISKMHTEHPKVVSKAVLYQTLKRIFEEMGKSLSKNETWEEFKPKLLNLTQ